MEEKQCKINSLQEAYKTACNYCATQERCRQEVTDKLYSRGIHNDEVEQIITQLIAEGFLNEERFAKAYAGGKFRMKKWGKVKIINELKKRKISDYCINKAMEEIDNAEYYSTFQTIIEKKSREMRENNSFIKAGKIAAYAISRGYESEMVWEGIRDSFDI